MNNTSFNSAQDEAELIRSIRGSADDEIRFLESETERKKEILLKQHQQEIDRIRKSEHQEMTRKIKHEINREVNRSLIDKQKLNLNVMESFANAMIAEAVSALHGPEWPRLKHFIVQAAVDVIQAMAGSDISVIVYGKHDQARQFKDNLLQSRPEAKTLDISLQDRADDTGITIKNPENSRSYHVSISRMCRRKREQLRKKIFQQISDKTNPDSSP